MDSDLHRMQYLDAESRVTEVEQTTGDLEDQLKETQDKLKAAEDKLKATKERLKKSRTALGKERKEARFFETLFKTVRYWQHKLSLRVDDLEATLLIHDGRISEPEKENKEMCNANNELLPDNKDPMEGMDVEPGSDQEDGDLRDNTAEDSEPIVSEEDPDEPPYYGDALTSPDTTVADE